MFRTATSSQLSWRDHRLHLNKEPSFCECPPPPVRQELFGGVINFREIYLTGSRLCDRAPPVPSAPCFLRVLRVLAELQAPSETAGHPLGSPQFLVPPISGSPVQLSGQKGAQLL